MLSQQYRDEVLELEPALQKAPDVQVSVDSLLRLGHEPLVPFSFFLSVAKADKVQTDEPFALQLPLWRRGLGHLRSVDLLLCEDSSYPWMSLPRLILTLTVDAEYARHHGRS